MKTNNCRTTAANGILFPHHPVDSRPERSPFFSALSRRIIHRHRGGWSGLVARILGLAEHAEALYSGVRDRAYLCALENDLARGAFVPNSPLLRSAGDLSPHLFACFALDPARLDVLRTARRIHDGMGGVGYPLDWTRTGTELRGFLLRVDDDTDAHQPGRPRPASNAGTISIEHDGLLDLLALCGRMRTMNLNTGISDAFMERIASGDARALERLSKVAVSIYRTGQPGIVFSDRIPRISAVPGAAFAANVCGEAPLAIDESGLLGSLNLNCFLTRGADGRWRLDAAALQAATQRAVRFLDGMHDLHGHPTASLRHNSLATRKLGVGVMGFAHALAFLGIRYGSLESEEFAAHVGQLLWTAALDESVELAHSRGAYPAWRADDGPRRRNACLVAIAGTATISLLVHASGGIEPIYAHWKRHRVIDRELSILDPAVQRFCDAYGVASATTDQHFAAGRPLGQLLPPECAALLPICHEVTGEEHIRVQAALQREIDGGITKTINCSRDTSPAVIERWLRLAWEVGLLGCTIYRDASIPDQPMKSVAA